MVPMGPASTLVKSTLFFLTEYTPPGLILNRYIRVGPLIAAPLGFDSPAATLLVGTRNEPAVTTKRKAANAG